jgi:hypothetical protein
MANRPCPGQRTHECPASVGAGIVHAQAGEQIDLFHKLLDQLAYHDQLSLLLEAVAIAWPLIKSSGDVMPWAIEAFSAQAADYVIFDFLEQHTATAADNPELIARPKDYIDVNPEKLARRLSYLTEQAGRRWTTQDFELKNQQHKQNLANLNLEFLGYLKRKEQVGYTKGDLAREPLLDYLWERQEGKLGR